MAQVEAEEGIDLYPESAKMPVFWATINAKEKIVVNQGGTYSGKSQAIIRVLFYYALTVPNIKIEVVGASIPKLTGDTLEIALHLFESNPIINARVIQYNASNRTFFFDNGAKMLFKSYATAKDGDGPKRDILYISEARNFSWACVEQLIKRTKRKIYIDYNPVELFWCHERIINCQLNKKGNKEYPSVKVLRSWHIHNQFISQDIHDSIENILDAELWKAYARGLTARVSGMVYPNWEVIEAFPLCDEIVWGMDLGFTNDPTVLVKTGINPYYYDANGAKVKMQYDYIFEELSYTPGIASGQIAKLLNEYGYKFGQPVYMDHSNTIQRELRALRIVAVKANKGPGCIAARILHLRTRRVAYTRKSENINEERKKYMFFSDKDGKITNEPNEGNDHAMNACEYASFSHAIRTGLIKGWADTEVDGSTPKM